MEVLESAVQEQGEEKRIGLQSEPSKENYRPPAKAEKIDLKKEPPEHRYFTLSKIRTYS